MVQREVVPRVAALAAATLMGLGCGSDSTVTDAGAADAVPDAGSPEEQLSQIIEEEMQELEVPGVAVALVLDGEVAWSKAFGVKSVTDPETALLPETIFLQGVTTEALTALGLLRLVDQGAVDLDAKITEYIPEFTLTRTPALAAEITVRHLLTQTTGLPDDLIHNGYDQNETELERYLTSSEFSDRFSMMFPAGEMYYHSKLAPGLSGLIIERASGQLFADYMRDEVFDPLGMDRATFRKDEAMAYGDEAWGTDDGETASAPFGTMQSWYRPCCIGYASVLDMAEFARFLAAGDPTVLSEGLREQMISPQQDGEFLLDRIQIGFGPFVSRGYISESEYGLLDYDLLTVSRLSVCMKGNTTNFVVVPDRRFAFVFAANRAPAYFNRSAIAALELFLGEPVAPLVNEPEDPANLADYAGTYSIDTGDSNATGFSTSELEVELTEGGVLRITNPLDENEMCGGEECDLQPVAPGNFVVVVTPEWPWTLLYPLDNITFLRDKDSGDVKYLRWPRMFLFANKE